ncbi:PID-CTERM protein-sorting domain-containing protein [Confluentibacter sediminis]|uniref:PID-CTERM protein-sorting domain-containing protein n=1 Tax=Confluentibacter sediminis TaxID=2219045 RepID=UPI000DAC9B48|nr:hypothetical protein [Confluentibacter sediminis]
MNTKNNFLKTMRIALIVFALTFSSNMHAATPAFGGGFFEWLGSFFNGGNLGGGHKGGGHKGGDSIPLDGGLGILLVGATAFGVKKLRQKNNEEA